EASASSSAAAVAGSSGSEGSASGRGGGGRHHSDGGTNSRSSDSGTSAAAEAAKTHGHANMAQYAKDLLNMLHMPITKGNVQFMQAWQRAEGGSPKAGGGDAS